MRSYLEGFSFSVFCGATFTKSSCLRGFTSSATLSTITTNRSSRSDTPSHCAHSGSDESEPRSLRSWGSLFAGGGRGASAGLAGSEGAWATAGGSSGVRRTYQIATAAIATATTASGIQGDRFFSMIRKHSHDRGNFGSGFNPGVRPSPLDARGRRKPRGSRTPTGGRRAAAPAFGRVPPAHVRAAHTVATGCAAVRRTGAAPDRDRPTG